MPTTTDLLANYEESEREAYAALTGILNGEIIDLAGGLAGIRFGGHYDQPRTPEQDDGDVDGWYVAAIDDDGSWIVTYEHKGDTGQREWVEARPGDYWRTDRCGTADVFRTAGHTASQGPLL